MKHIAVIVRAGHIDRVAEAMRAAVGLGLRGDHIHVLLTAAALPALADPRVARAAATLTELGHDVTREDQPPATTTVTAAEAAEAAASDTDTPLARILRHADAIEVWT